MAFLESPQIFRNIPRIKLTSRLSVLFGHDSKSVFGGLARILMAIVILVAAVFVWYKNLNFVQNLDSRFARIQNPQKQQSSQVLGEETEVRVDVREEIARTKAVLESRPDYAAAWLRLAILYEQMGEIELAADARNTAVKLNPDLEDN